jgi:arsenate reductase
VRKKVLFLCTGNSCRSQMAEGLTTHLLGNSIEAFSAGTDPQPLNQYAVEVMQEIGIDISRHRPKQLSEFENTPLNLIVTVCDNAAKSCPTPSRGTKVIHAPFDDPPRLTSGMVGKDEILMHYRRVRDEIKQFISTLPTLMDQ